MISVLSPVVFVTKFKSDLQECYHGVISVPNPVNTVSRLWVE